MSHVTTNPPGPAAAALPEVLRVEELSTSFHLPEGVVPAVCRVSFTIHQGETVCLVGESGCGKSVTAMSIMRLIPCPPGRIDEGRVWFEGQDLISLPAEAMRPNRGDRNAMIIQEPMTAHNPQFTVGDQIAEVYRTHKGAGRRASLAEAAAMLGKVGIPSPAERVNQYIHEMSGGMRQRAMIAMALACRPRLLIADEPTTALDVTIQAQILKLMRELQETTGAAILLITHNFGVVAEMADRVIVMYLGRVVEDAPVEEIFERPLHPSAPGLLASIPVPGRRRLLGARPLEEIPGMVPSLFDLPTGCGFSPRCRLGREACRQREPRLIERGGRHQVACLAVEEGWA